MANYYIVDSKYMLSIVDAPAEFDVEEDGLDHEINGVLDGPGSSVWAHSDRKRSITIDSYYWVDKDHVPEGRCLFSTAVPTDLRGKYRASAIEFTFLGWGNDPHAKAWLTTSTQIWRTSDNKPFLEGSEQGKKVLDVAGSGSLSANISKYKWFYQRQWGPRLYFNFSPLSNLLIVHKVRFTVECRGNSRFEAKDLSLVRNRPQLILLEGGEGTLDVTYPDLPEGQIV